MIRIFLDISKMFWLPSYPAKPLQKRVSEKFEKGFEKPFLWRMTTNVKAPRLLFHSMRAQDDFLYCQPHLHSVQNYNTSIYLFSKQKSRQTFICQKTVKVFHLKICLVAFVSFDSISVKSHPNSRKVIKIKIKMYWKKNIIPVIMNQLL